MKFFIATTIIAMMGSARAFAPAKFDHTCAMVWSFHCLVHCVVAHIVLTHVLSLFLITLQRQPTELYSNNPKGFANTALAGILAFGLSLAPLAVTSPAFAMTKAESEQLSYLQVKGTGLANRCADVEGDGIIKLDSSKAHKIVDFCIEPKVFAVEEEFGGNGGKPGEKRFVNAKVMTRQTYTLDSMEGPLIKEGNQFVFHEKDGLDYAPIILKTPSQGEGILMLFNVKELVARFDGNVVESGQRVRGEFHTPSYRTGLFQDPKGRGGTTGYDMAVALPALQSGLEGDDRIYKENNKVFDDSKGFIEMEVSQVDDATNEFGGVYISTQLGDSDMGAHEAKKIMTKGIFYGRIE